MSEGLLGQPMGPPFLPEDVRKCGGQAFSAHVWVGKLLRPPRTLYRL